MIVKVVIGWMDGWVGGYDEGNEKELNGSNGHYYRTKHLVS